MPRRPCLAGGGKGKCECLPRQSSYGLVETGRSCIDDWVAVSFISNIFGNGFQMGGAD